MNGVARGFKTAVTMSALDLSELLDELYDLQAEVHANPAAQDRVLRLIQRIEGYLERTTHGEVSLAMGDYHPHLPGMEILIAQAQQQQQQ